MEEHSDGKGLENRMQESRAEGGGNLNFKSTMTSTNKVFVLSVMSYSKLDGDIFQKLSIRTSTTVVHCLPWMISVPTLLTLV